MDMNIGYIGYDISHIYSCPAPHTALTHRTEAIHGTAAARGACTTDRPGAACG